MKAHCGHGFFGVLAVVAVVAVVAVLAPGFNARAYDDDGDDDSEELNGLLRGSYRFSQMNACVTTRNGELPPTFDEETLALVGPAEAISFQTDGVTRFDGNGRVAVRGRSMAVFSDRVDAGDSPIGPPVGFTCDGSYRVSANRTFGIDVACTGPLFAVAPIRLQGAISTDRKTLILSDVEPTIERLTVDGTVIGERICIAMATDIKAHKAD